MLVHAAVVLLVLDADPQSCPDRACLVAAAKQCKSARGKLDTADWPNVASMVGSMVGSTEVSVVKGADGECSLSLRLHIDKLEIRPENRTENKLTDQQRLDLLNNDHGSTQRCEAKPEELSHLLEVIGTKAVRPWDLQLCFPTICDPAPPLAAGCKAGPCAKGGYDITCGAKTCRMAGMKPDPNDAPTLFACGDTPGSVQMTSPPAAAPKKKHK